MEKKHHSLPWLTHYLGASTAYPVYSFLLQVSAEVNILAETFLDLLMGLS